MSAIRIVCFDLGGVVVRLCRSWNEACRRAGLDVRLTDAQADVIANRHWLALIVAYQTGRIDAVTHDQRLSALLDGLYSAVEIRAVHDAWLRGEYDGVADLITRVHEAGLATAALSNTNPEHWSRMEDFPAFRSIGQRFASHLLQLHKPDPAIFRRFEDLTGHRGGEIVFFDDTAENVDAAAGRGWHAVRIDPARETRPQMESALQSLGILPNGAQSSLSPSSESD